jgi:hypothetical protein
VVGDILVVDLTAGAAADDMGVWKHRPQFVIAIATRQNLAFAKEKNQIAVSIVAGGGRPPGVLAPGKLRHAHRYVRPLGRRALEKFVTATPENSVYLCVACVLLGFLKF